MLDILSPHTRTQAHTHIHTPPSNICICRSILLFISTNILVKVAGALVWTSLHVPTGYNDTSVASEATNFLISVENVRFWGFHSSFAEDSGLLGRDDMPLGVWLLMFWMEIVPSEHQNHTPTHTSSHPRRPQSSQKFWFSCVIPRYWYTSTKSTASHPRRM